MCGSGNSFLESVTNTVLQLGTVGLAGYKSDEGGLTTGVTGDIVKDVTGATAAEEANTLAREQLEQEAADTLAEQEEAKAQVAAEELTKSRQASSTRSGTRISNYVANNRISNLADEESDILGL